MNYFLIILTFSVALVGLLKEHLPPKYNKRVIVALLIGFLITLTALQVCQEHQTAKREWQAKWSGRLRSPVKTQQRHPVLKLGNTRIEYAGEPDKPVYTLAEEPLTVGLSGGRAELSLVIRDKHGIVLAAIRNNEWFVARPPVTLDRNFNENSLEVIDPKGEVVFQAQVYGEEVRLAGNFYSISGSELTTFRPWVAETLSGRLFKYPSSEHPATLANE